MREDFLYPQEIKKIDCPRCRYMIPIEEHQIDYKREYELERVRFKELYCSINTAMQTCETLYGMNPFKDKIEKELEILRETFKKEVL